MSNDENKSLVVRWFEEGFWADDLDKSMEAVFATDYYLTSNGIGYDGREEIKTFVKALRAAFPEGKIKVQEVIAEGDTVAWHHKFTARNTGDFMGAPPTGELVTVTGSGWARIKDGRFVEAKENWDQFALMQQMGAIPGE